MAVDSGPSDKQGQPGLVQAALSGLCPQCGASTLFEAPARIALSCSNCSLQLAELERGGRLAGLVTILMAVLLIMIAMGIDIALSPPFWLQVVVWGPLTIAVVIGALRLFKTALLYRQYGLQPEGSDK